MASVIKASDRERAVHGVAFNFDDIAASAVKYLDKVRAEAADIIAQARLQAETEAQAIRARAEQEGRAAGQATIDQTVQRQLGQQLTTLMPALHQMVEEIRLSKQSWLTHWERCAVHVAASIAQRVIRRELSQSPQITLTLLREALELAAGSARIQVRMNPEDHHSLLPQIELVLKEAASVAPVDLVADPHITPGGCRLETQFGAIDQQIEAQLARIEEELT